MQFHEFMTMWQYAQRMPLKKMGRDLFYQTQSEHAEKSGSFYFSHILDNEAEWYERRRPYYKVYPCIVDALCKLNLNFKCECPKVPEGTISIRFAEGHEPKSQDGHFIEAMLVHSHSDSFGHEVLFIQVTLKENSDAYWFYFDTNDPNCTIEELFRQDFPREHPRGEIRTEEKALTVKYEKVRVLAARIALTVLMLADDPEIITRDVLASDQNRYDAETNQANKIKAENKAKNKGVFGWSVGKNIQVAPHVRRPHWAVRWTGQGKKIPQVRPIKGCKVNWDKLTNVPTGHMLPDGTEVEKGKIAS